MLNIKCRKNNFLEDENLKSISNSSSNIKQNDNKYKIKKRFPINRSNTSDNGRSMLSNKKNFPSKRIIITTSNKNPDWIRPESSDGEREYASGNGNPIVFISKLVISITL